MASTSRRVRKQLKKVTRPSEKDLVEKTNKNLSKRMERLSLRKTIRYKLVSKFKNVRV